MRAIKEYAVGVPVRSLEMLHSPESDLPAVTGMLRALAGIYEQAAQATTI